MTRTSPPFVKDLIEQAYTLLYKRALDEEGKFVEDTKGLRRGGEVALLDERETRTSLKLVQKYMVALAQEHLLYMATSLVELAGRFPSSKTPVNEATQPSKSDRAETVDDYTDSTPEFWALQALAKCLQAHVQADDLARVPSSVMTYCFECLDYGFSPAIRHAAGDCLGYLSVRFHLKDICTLFEQKMDTVNKHTERDFVSYQKAISALAFDVRTEKRLMTTTNYLVRLLSMMKTCERGVLRQEICTSLEAVFRKFMPHTLPAEDVEKWREVRDTDAAKPFWQCFDEIYTVVKKWSKKSKHASFCIETLCTMCCVCCAALYFPSRGKEWLTLITSAVKSSSTRPQTLVLLRRFFDELDPDLVNANLSRYTEQVNLIMPRLLNKSNKNVAPEEGAVLVAILAAIGRLSLSHTFHFTHDMFTDAKNVYSVPQRAVALRAVATLTHEYPREAREFTDAFHPITTLILEEGVQSEIELIRAALPLWPTIAPPPDRGQVVVKRYARFAMEPDREIHSRALAALGEYITLEAQQFPTVMELLLRPLLQLRGHTQEGLHQATHNICVVLSSFIDHLNALVARGEAPPNIDPDAWLKVRVAVEGAALTWMCSPEVHVHAEVSIVLDTLAHDALKHLEVGGNLPPVPFLCEVLGLDAKPIRPPKGSVKALRLIEWHPSLSGILVRDTHRETYREAVSYAWVHLCDRLTDPRDSFRHPGQLQPDAFTLWTHHVKFLCLGLRLLKSNAVQDSAVLTLEKASKVLEYLYSFMCGDTPQEVADVVTKSLCRVVASAWDPVVQRLKPFVSSLSRERQSASAATPQKKKTTAPLPPIDYYALSDVIAFYAKLSMHFPSDVFSSSVVLYGAYQDLCCTWMAQDHKGMFDAFPVSTRADVATIVAEFLMRTDANKDVKNLDSAIPATAEENRAAVIFHFLMRLLNPPAPKGDPNEKKKKQPDLAPMSPVSKKDRKKMELAALHAVLALCRCGPLNSEALERECIMFLQKMIYSGTHMQPDTDAALTAFVKYNRKHANKLLTSSVFTQNDILSEEEERTQTRGGTPLPANWPWAWRMCCLRALCNNIAAGAKAWSGELGRVRLIFFTLLHLTSNNILARQVAVRVVQRLSYTGDPPLPIATSADEHFALCGSTHVDRHLCVQTAVCYSQALARSYVALTAPLLKEAAWWMTELRLTLGDKQNMLLVLGPWTANIRFLTSRESSEPNQRAENAALSAMTSITRACVGTSATSNELTELEQLWRNLLEGGVMDEGLNLLLIDSVVHFLLSHADTANLASSAQEDSATPEAEILSVCRRCCLYLCRTACKEVVIRALVARLTTYPDPIPADPSEFTEWYTRRGGTVHSGSAFALLAAVAFENPLSLRSHLPTLLHTAFVWQTMEGSTYRRLGNEVVRSLFRSYALYHTTTLASTGKMDAATFLEDVLAFGTANFADASAALQRTLPLWYPGCHTDAKTGKEQDPAPRGDMLRFVVKTVAGLQPEQRAKLRRECADVALRWAVASKDEEEASQSLKVFGALTADYNGEMLQKLASFCLVCIQHKRDLTLNCILDLLQDVARQTTDEGVVRIVLSVAATMLLSPVVQRFRGGLLIIRACVERKGERDLELLRHTELIGSGPLPISVTIVRGLTDARTIEDTMWLMQAFAQYYTDKSPADNAVLALLLVVHVVLIVVRAGTATGNGKEMSSCIAETGYAERLVALASIVEDVETGEKGCLDFLSPLMAAVQKSFSTTGNFKFLLVMLRQLLSEGLPSWRWPLLRVLCLLLELYEEPVDTGQFVDVAELVVKNSFSVEYVPEVAQQLLMRITTRIDEKSAPAELFNFVRSNPSSSTPGPRDVFSGYDDAVRASKKGGGDAAAKLKSFLIRQEARSILREATPQEATAGGVADDPYSYYSDEDAPGANPVSAPPASASPPGGVTATEEEESSSFDM